MTSFQISAPGRVFLCGDHVVSFGNQVVAASLNLRTTLKFHKLPLEERIVKIELPKVDISLNIPLERITSLISDGETFNLIIDEYSSFLRYVRYFNSFNQLWTTFEQKFSLEIFFFLLYVIAQNEKLAIQPFYVHLTTVLPMNAGLGSSTSFATCLAACFLHWSYLERGDHSGFTPEKLERISGYVMSYEKILWQYKQDHIICTYGHVTAFQYRDQLNVQREIINTPEINILLVDANICLDKNQQMQQLTDMKNRNDKALNDHLSEIKNRSQNMISTLYLIRDLRINTDLRIHGLKGSYQDLQANLSWNQMALSGLNLSHSNFNTINSIAQNCGFGGKSTGVGASKAIIPLLPNSYHLISYKRKISKLMKNLNESNFNSQITTISCTGVRLE
ncbi:mevalonate kinase-like [Camponotus floridanus]|uniref:mevalonate kinase-like n=1 Tax=Camponotus floridanus TaxID=104421 RepID=UPI000DC66E9D|nr:mevalonate kinase-like [Camponotus floridanus]